MCNLLKIKHVGESDELPCPMTFENFTHGQASPPDIQIQLSDDGANHGQRNQTNVIRVGITKRTIL